MDLLRCLAAAWLFALGACTAHVTTELPVVEAPTFALREESGLTDAAAHDDVLVVGGPWERFVPLRAPPPAAPAPTHDSALLARGAEETLPEDPRERALAKLLARGERSSAPQRPPMAIPVPRSGKFLRSEGGPPTRAAEQLARDHVLDWPTRVEAREITLHCPASAAAEARLVGDERRELGRNLQVAYGNAHLTCRELTLVADRITLRFLPAEDDHLRIVARGDARFAMRVREQVFQEPALRSLMILNDRIVPLR